MFKTVLLVFSGLLALAAAGCSSILAQSSAEREYEEMTRGLPIYVMQNGALDVDGVQYIYSNWYIDADTQSKPFCVVDDRDHQYYKTMAFYYISDDNNVGVEYQYEWDYGSGYIADTLIREDDADNLLDSKTIARFELYWRDERRAQLVKDPAVIRETIGIVYYKQADDKIEIPDSFVYACSLRFRAPESMVWTAHLYFDGSQVLIEIFENGEAIYRTVPDESWLCIQILDNI